MSLRHRFIQYLPKQSVSIAQIIACAALTTMCASPTLAQDADNSDPRPPGERPAAAGRVVRAFDFEEQDYNPLPIPGGWVRAQEDPAVPRIRPGFPIWNGAILDYKSPAYSGIGTLRLPTSGGSTSLILRRGEINIFPNADYIISARVRTVDLNYAKARVLARLINRKGEKIEGATATTPLANTKGKWEQVSLEIEGVYPNAAFVEIELQLLQPEQQDEDASLNKFIVWDQDFKGNAYFDNLIIAQLPRLEISTGTPGNIVESQTTPALHVLVRDLTGDAIIARARIFDVHGKIVDSETLADGSKRVRTDWKPSLPGYGWYRAVLEVVVDDQLVGIRTLDFIWSSPSEKNPDSGMFGMYAKLTNPKIAQSAPALIKGTGITRASVEVWSYETTLQDIDPQADTMQAIDELITSGTQISIVLAELPKQLARTLARDPNEVMPVFAGPSSAWVGWASKMLDQYGQAISNWRFGQQATQESAATLNTQLDAIKAALSGYVPGPMLVTPWSIDRPIEDEIIRENQQLLVYDHNATGEQAMPLVVEDWAVAANRYTSDSGEPPPTLGMVLSPMHESGTWSGTEVWSSVSMLARKAISFWWAASSTGLGNDRFDLELRDAWWVSSGKRGQVMPAPELVVWRTLAKHLGGRQAIEELDIVPGVRMLVAGPKRTTSQAQRDEHTDKGIMILWLDEPGIEQRILNLPLSTGRVMRCDVFNNQTPVDLARVGDLALPVHRIAVGRSPIIITGVNTQLVRFLSSIELTPDSLQAISGIHKHELKLSNPWPITIRGQVYIVEPGGYTASEDEIDRSWEIRPRVFPFVLDAYEQQQLPLTIAYSLGEIAGEKQLTFDVELSADKDYPLMRVEGSIELGLDGIEMRLAAQRGPDGVTIIAVHVTNKLDIIQDFEVIAIPPNESRLRRSISGIAPGEQVTREFAFTKTNAGDEVIVALLLRESSVRLNKSVTVP